MRKSCATTPESMPCAQFIGHFQQKIKSNGQSNAKYRILPDSSTNCFRMLWSHLGLNQGLPDYESGALTN